MDPEARRTEPVRVTPRGPEFGSAVCFALSSTGEPSPPVWRISLPRVEVVRTVGQALDVEPVLREMAARAAYGSGGFSIARLRDYLRSSQELLSEKRKPEPDRRREIRIDPDVMLDSGDFEAVRLPRHHLEALEPFLYKRAHRHPEDD